MAKLLVFLVAALFGYLASELRLRLWIVLAAILAAALLAGCGSEPCSPDAGICGIGTPFECDGGVDAAAAELDGAPPVDAAECLCWYCQGESCWCYTGPDPSCYIDGGP